MQPSPSRQGPDVRAGSDPATIAFVHHGANWIRGSEQCLLDLVARLPCDRFRSVVVCNSTALADAATALGANVERVEAWEQGVVRVSKRARTQIRDLLVTHRANLIHVNVPDPIPTLVPVARELRVPIVAHLHMSLGDPTFRLYSLLHQPTVAVGVAQHVVRGLLEDGMPRDRVRVIHNAVDEARIEAGDARALRASLGIGPDALTVSSVGSLIARKGHDVTIDAVARARAQGTDVHLVLCGDGPDGGALRDRIAELEIAPYVHLLGYRGDAGAVVRDASDALASSARDEALNLNVLEAQWLGTAVIASDIPAHREAVENGTTGIIVPLDDPRALAAALVALHADPVRRRTLAAAGRDIAHQRYTMARYVREFVALYDDLLARPRGAYGWLRGSTWPKVYTPWALGMARRRLGLR